MLLSGNWYDQPQHSNWPNEGRTLRKKSTEHPSTRKNCQRVMNSQSFQGLYSSGSSNHEHLLTAPETECCLPKWRKLKVFCLTTVVVVSYILEGRSRSGALPHRLGYRGLPLLPPVKPRPVAVSQFMQFLSQTKSETSLQGREKTRHKSYQYGLLNEQFNLSGKQLTFFLHLMKSL